MKRFSPVIIAVVLVLLYAVMQNSDKQSRDEEAANARPAPTRHIV